MSRVMLIEDDLDMQGLIKEYLEDFGFEVDSYANPKDALFVLKESNFDIVILDLMLPQMDGFDVCRLIKKEFDIPVIISSARGDIGNKIMGFELGVEDYLAKPYEPRELVLRIEAILKRDAKDGSVVGDFYIDEVNRVVKVEDYEVDFTKVEFDIFLHLLKHRQKVVSREQLIHVANIATKSKNRTIDMHISNIRCKIGDDLKNTKYIKSVWGIGYKFL